VTEVVEQWGHGMGPHVGAEVTWEGSGDDHQRESPICVFEYSKELVDLAERWCLVCGSNGRAVRVVEWAHLSALR
jgi:hypothetical protein